MLQHITLNNMYAHPVEGCSLYILLAHYVAFCTEFPSPVAKIAALARHTQLYKHMQTLLWTPLQNFEDLDDFRATQKKKEKE